MNLNNKFSRIAQNPWEIFLYPIHKGWLDFLSDKHFLKIKYRAELGKKLNLKHPKGFNEKLQWLKLYDRKPEYTVMVDKYAVKKYVADKIGEEYIIPTLGVWSSFDEIDFNKLPNQFVLKCTHDSGGLVICKDKALLNKKAAKEKLEKSLNKNYYLAGREWPYKDVPRKIIAEKFMEDSESEDLKDYKLMCFDGKVNCSFVCSERFEKDGLKVTFFDNDWNVLPFERHYPKSSKPIAKPENFEKMIQFAEKLSEKIPFVRTDFYEINGKLYFGELTFFPGSGYEEFIPESADYELGKWIKLPLKSGGGI